MTRYSNEHIYFLTKSSAERVDGVPSKKTNQINHTLLRNEVWLMLRLPDWQVETPITLNVNGKDKKIIPDALIVSDTLYCILNYMYQAQKGKKVIIKFFTTLNFRKLLIENFAGEFELVCEDYVIDVI